jgi:hypothetical protein
MGRPLVIDGRNLLDPAAMIERGFEYYNFGRPMEIRTQTPISTPTFALQIPAASSQILQT